MRMRTRFVLLLCLLMSGGCAKTKSTDELIDDLKSNHERDRIIAVRLLPQRKEDAAKIVPAAQAIAARAAIEALVDHHAFADTVRRDRRSPGW